MSGGRPPRDANRPLEQLVLRVFADQKVRLRELSDRSRVAQSEIVRQVFDFVLPQIDIAASSTGEIVLCGGAAAAGAAPVPREIGPGAAPAKETSR